MPAAPMSMPTTTEPLRPRKGSHPRPRRAHVPQALALKHEPDYAYSARRRSSLAGAPTAPPVVYSFLPSASPGAGWTISPATSVSPADPAPISLFASTAAVSPAVYARRPSAPRVRRVDGDATRPSFDSSRLHFPLPPTSPPRPRMSVSRPTPAPAHPLSPTERPTTPHTTGISRASLAQVAQPPLPARSTTLEDAQMYDDLKTFVFGAASVSHDVDMDDGASDAASAYNPLSPALRPDGGAFPRRPSKSAARRPSRAGMRDGAAIASGKRRNSRAWIPSDSTVARPEIAVTSASRDQDCDADDEDHDELIRMMERAKMRAIDDGARRPSLPINIPDSAARRGSRDSNPNNNKPLPDTPPRRPSGALATAGFDLDYILAGPASFPQATAGQGIAPTPGVAMSWDSYQQQSRRNSAIAPFASVGHEMQTLDVEDTFLSMVRQLDTEYARRRNKWSFRQEPRRAYDYDLDPDEEVWGCEPVGTFWVGKDREAMHPAHEGPTPVIIKPLQPQVSPKSQATPQERRSDIRLVRDEKRPMWKLSMLPAGSQSTVPVKILLATKAMHLKIASVPLRPEGRRRGHTIHADEMSLASSSGELGRIEELPPHPKTSHAVAFDTLTDAELDHAGRKHITFSERIRRAFGSESPPPTNAHAHPSFSPPWLMMAPQSAKEEQMRQIRELHTAFRAVGLLTPPKPGAKDPNQPHAIKPVRMPEEKPGHHETPASILEDIPADALCMTLPLWQFRGGSNKDEGLGASLGVPVHEREYLLVYFVPLGASDTPTPAPASRLSKKRSRGNMDRRQSSSISAAASWAKGRRTAFHVVARVLSAVELCATGLRHPSTLPASLATLSSRLSAEDRKRRAFPSVIAMCNGTGTSVEFVPEGLDRLGLCTPSFEWQSESERFPGLTPVGIEVVEMVWAGCVAVLGIST